MVEACAVVVAAEVAAAVDFLPAAAAVAEACAVVVAVEAAEAEVSIAVAAAAVEVADAVEGVAEEEAAADPGPSWSSPIVTPACSSHAARRTPSSP